jgi:hypothetical protein
LLLRSREPRRLMLRVLRATIMSIFLMRRPSNPYLIHMKVF